MLRTTKAAEVFSNMEIWADELLGGVRAPSPGFWIMSYKENCYNPD
jgi:hypothetical protein